MLKGSVTAAFIFFKIATILHKISTTLKYNIPMRIIYYNLGRKRE